MPFPTPAYHQFDEFQNRSRKLEELRKMGIQPYPHSFTPSHNSDVLHKEFEKAEIGHSEDAASGVTPSVKIAGRLVLFRPMGKNAFGQIQDHMGRIQVMFNRELTTLQGYTPKPESDDPQPLKMIEKLIDLGDIIGLEGHLFHTNKGELTLFIKRLFILTKTLLPLAEKHAGLADKELRYRKRWLDLITTPETSQVLRQRSQIFRLIRDFMEERQFIEVETPVLQSIYGGAEAKPFKTELNALDQEMFLRISLEIPLKKLIVGGMDRVYEIGRVFRNEGIDRNHNPEFTLLEAYAAYWDYNDLISSLETLFEGLAIKLHGKTEIPARHPHTGEEITLNLKAPWIRMTMKEALKTYGKIDPDTLQDEEMRKILLDSGHVAPEKIPHLSRGLLIAALFEVFAEPYLIQPHHIVDHPIETTPLCKPHRSPEEYKEGLVERVESFILCNEVCNGYTELNDPVLQRELLVFQAERREAGDEEASPLDEEFIEAICQGMPPTAGIGIGLDRLVMILTNQHSIRDVLFFHG